MSEKKLTRLKRGEEGEILSFNTGHQAGRRLEALGLRIGKKIKKLSGGFWGPVTVQVGHTQVGIGRGMAAKVMVRVKK